MWNDMFRFNIFLIPFDLFFKSTTMCTLRHHKKTKNRYISPKNMVFVSRIGRRSDATVVQLSAVQHCEQKKSKKGRFFTHIQHYCTLAKKTCTYLSPNYSLKTASSSWSAACWLVQEVDSSPKFLFTAQSAHSNFEAPSGGDFYPEEKRQNKAFLFCC